MTQNQVAAYLYISPRYYKFIESGHRTGGNDLWKNLENLLGVPQKILRQDMAGLPPQAGGDAVKMKPILFNTEMVRAILDGWKTVTRRVVKDAPNEEGLKPCKTMGFGYGLIAPNSRVYPIKPLYRPGDILYVRETWCDPSGTGWPILYKADMPLKAADYKWYPSIHMPREAARIFLRVTDVRVERLRPISDTACMAEGITCAWNVDLPDAFAEVWNSTIKPADRGLYGWEANPWVWVIEFERCEKP